MKTLFFTMIYITCFTGNFSFAESSCEQAKDNFLQSQNISQLDNAIRDLEYCYENNEHIKTVEDVKNSLPQCIDQVTAEKARARVFKLHIKYLENVKKDSSEVLKSYIDEIIYGFNDNEVFTHASAWQSESQLSKLALGFSKNNNGHDDYVQSPLIKVCGDAIRVNNWQSDECTVLKEKLYKIQQLPNAVHKGLFIQANYNSDSQLPKVYSRLQDFVNYSFSNEDGKVFYSSKEDSEKKFNDHFKDIKAKIEDFNKNECQTSGLPGLTTSLSAIDFYSSTQVMSSVGGFKFTTQKKKDTWYDQLQVLYELIEPITGAFNIYPPERNGEIIAK